MKKIINYCSGGLGNRLKPLASCYAISQLTGRKLEMYWHPTMRCGGIFDKLFTNTIDNIEYDWLHSVTNAKIYSYQSYIDHDANLNGNNQLQTLSRKFPVVPLDRCHEILLDDAETIIIYDNGFLPGINLAKTNEFFKLLNPVDEIKQAVSSFCKSNNINKTVIGVHARGTDFESSGVSAEHYLNMIRTHVKPGRRFLLCSDSKEYEDYIQKALPGYIITIPKNNYVSKNGGGSWTNNVLTPHDSVKDSLVDLYTLAETSFLLYNESSTFAHIVLELLKSRN